MLRLVLDSSAIQAVLEQEGPEVAVEIQKRIVQQFAERHLKAVVNTEVIKKAEVEVTRAAAWMVEEMVGKSTGVGHSHRRTITLNADIRRQIKNRVEADVEELVLREVHKRVAEVDIEQKVQAKVTWHIQRQVDEEVRSRWNAVVDEMSKKVKGE